MHSIITEELRFRKRVCEYAIKHGNNAGYRTKRVGTLIPIIER